MSMGDSFCSIFYLQVQSFLLQDSTYNLSLPFIDTLSWKSPAYDSTFVLLPAENPHPAVAPWSSPPLYTFTVHIAFPLYYICPGIIPLWCYPSHFFFVLAACLYIIDHPSRIHSSWLIRKSLML